MPKLEPLIVDPRRHDAVLFDLDAVVTAEGSASDSTVTLSRNCSRSGSAPRSFRQAATARTY